MTRAEAIARLQGLQAESQADAELYAALGFALGALYAQGKVTRRRGIELRTRRGERMVLDAARVKELEVHDGSEPT